VRPPVLVGRQLELAVLDFMAATLKPWVMGIDLAKPGSDFSAEFVRRADGTIDLVALVPGQSGELNLAGANEKVRSAPAS
jgi:hypothetical protein